MPDSGQDDQIALRQAPHGPIGHLQGRHRVVGPPDQVDGTPYGVELRLIGLVDQPVPAPGA